jgi:hypothetical protein
MTHLGRENGDWLRIGTLLADSVPASKMDGLARKGDWLRIGMLFADSVPVPFSRLRG